MSHTALDQRYSITDIDQLALDKECVNLPTTFLRWMDKSINAKAKVAELKARLEVVEADCSKQVRDRPAKFGIDGDKASERSIAAIVPSLPEYKAALQAMNQAIHEQDMAGAVVSALEHKKRSLTLLVDLHGQGYFSNVKMTREGKEAVSEMTKRQTRRAWKDD